MRRIFRGQSESDLPLPGAEQGIRRTVRHAQDMGKEKAPGRNPAALGLWLTDLDARMQTP